MTQVTQTPADEDRQEAEFGKLQESAGSLLRSFRNKSGLNIDSLAATLHVPAAKLQALEDDQWDVLPDAMFARALALAVCRHLHADASEVLALLPQQDVSRVAIKDERGLDFPLQRPSFLPQSSFLVIEKLFTPLRWAALAVLALALLLAVWPDLQSWFEGPGASRPSVMPAPIETDAPSIVVLPPSASKEESSALQMVITPVQSAAATAPASTASGVANGQ
jgi:cytoskeleton protein RodZ